VDARLDTIGWVVAEPTILDNGGIEMALMQWEPLSELGTMQNEMNRLFNTLFAGPRQANGDRRWIPAMDLLETENDFVLRADLPGLSEDDLNIELQGTTLTVSGERTSEHDGNGAGYHRLERGWGSFARSLTMPEGIDPDGISARFDRGVLEVHIPKPEQHKPRRIAIAATGDRQKEIEA
jgi:HSP20 family protein